MTFLFAKQRTLHIFGENGKPIPVCLKERDGNVAVFESKESIPVGVFVEWLGSEAAAKGTVLNCRPVEPASTEGEKPQDAGLLEISVEFNSES